MYRTTKVKSPSPCMAMSILPMLHVHTIAGVKWTGQRKLLMDSHYWKLINWLITLFIVWKNLSHLPIYGCLWEYAQRPPSMHGYGEIRFDPVLCVHYHRRPIWENIKGFSKWTVRFEYCCLALLSNAFKKYFGDKRLT